MAKPMGVDQTWPIANGTFCACCQTRLSQENHRSAGESPEEMAKKMGVSRHGFFLNVFREPQMGQRPNLGLQRSSSAPRNTGCGPISSQNHGRELVNPIYHHFPVVKGVSSNLSFFINQPMGKGFFINQPMGKGHLCDQS